MGLSDRWYAWRNRWLASARFRRWASEFPLSRGIARRRARAVFDLCAGFVYSQVLLACVRLRLLELLAERPQSVPVIARRTGLPLAGAARLVEAAVALRLAASRGEGLYGLGELGATVVGEPAIKAMVEHHALLYADLHDPVALLRGEGTATALAQYWPYARAASPESLSADGVADYSALMAASQSLVASQVLSAFRFDRFTCLLDIGGGEGAFLTAVAARAPRLQLMLFDLPSVADRAMPRLAAAGLGARVRVVGGDFLKDPLPAGADVATLVRVLHDHDDANALALLRAVRRALPSGGEVLVAEPMADVAGAEPMGAAYFGFYLLAMGQGRPRRQNEISALLKAAGFVDPRALTTAIPLQTGLMVARAG